MEKREYESAILWYHPALDDKRGDTGGFQNPDYSTWINNYIEN